MSQEASGFVVDVILKPLAALVVRELADWWWRKRRKSVSDASQATPADGEATSETSRSER
jgi:hypothetical protein